MRRLAASLWLLLALGALAPAAADAGPRERWREARAAREQMPPSLRDWLRALPDEQRRIAARRIRQMPPGERSARFAEWEEMSEAERQAFQQDAVGRIDRALALRAELSARYQAMPPAERERFRAALARWRVMPPSERLRMRDRLERFRALGAEAQAELIARRYPTASETQRGEIVERLREAAELLPPK